MAGPGRGNAPRRSVRNQKKQTTLQFSPLPSSSPAKTSYSPAVQSRLASVRYEGSRQLSKTPGIGENNDLDDVVALPTPEPSSQVHGSSHMLSETPPRSSLPSSPLTTHPPDVHEDIVDTDDEDDLIPSASKSRKFLPDTGALSSTQPRRSTRLYSSSASRPVYSTRSSKEGPAEPQSSPLKRRPGRLRRRSTTRRSARSPGSSYQSSDNGSLDELSTPIVQPTTTLSDFGSPESSDDEDLVMASKPAARRRQSKKAVQHDPFIVNDDEIQYISEDEVQQVSALRARKAREDDFIVEDSDAEYISSGDAAVQGRGKARRLSTSHKSPHKRRNSRRQQKELDEDLRDLQDFDQDHDEVRTRTRGGPVTTQRDKTREHFDLLRRRRAGERAPRVQDSDDEEEEQEAEGVDLDFIGHPDYDMSPEGSVHSSIDTDKESQLEQQEDEDDFVVEDSADRLGRRHPDIPLEFTSFASAKPRELFPHIIEWLIKNKIAPAFSRNDELYTLSFDRIDAQVKGQAGSRLISAAWGMEFKRAILARPHMKVEALPGEDADNIRDCDACNRSGHPARYEFVFLGQPYFKKTLEPVDNSDDDEENYGDDDDGASRDENGHLLPPENRRFYLGRFCAANAEMGHKLTHWKYHLNESLMAYLEEQGVLSADAIIARDKLPNKKREKEAENIVDNMQETGVIAEFWAEFENDLNDARLGMEDYDKKGGRSKGRVGAIRAKANGSIREWAGDKYRVTIAVDSDSEGE